MANIENLKPFKSGEDARRNLKGAPKKIPALDVLLADVLGDINNEGIEVAQEIILALVNKAKKGDTRAIEILFDRAYGKASQNLTLDGGINFRIPAPIVYNIAPPLSHSENEVMDVD
jgi:hypothetical protein